ncbi:MAG: tripartite tricarboxylate transporter substrate binding protein [Burkholderiaceae bacterium]|nr:tripartite tricarboxylate transporter substrate binding protein [Burkholderiaceae bacterium]
MTRRRLLLTRLLTPVLLALPGWAVQAQEIPKKPITLVVGFAAGGAADHAARVVAKKLSENLGITVVIDNKAGAGGNIAHDLVAKATPDGSVILLGSVGPLAIAPHLTKLPYDPQKDLAPLTMGMNFPNVLVVPPSLGVKNFAEFMALAKARPGQLNYGSTGVASASHLAGELFNAIGGVDIVHIPFKGGAPAMNELLAGRLSAYFATMSTAGPHIAAGKLIPLATTGLARAPFLPDLPTVSEAGLKGFTATNWYAFVAPARMASALQERWNQELVKALKSPEVADELNRAGLLPAPGTREELARTIASESRTWARVIAERKITAE